MARRRLRLRHFIILLICAYLIFTFVSQQIKLNELVSQRVAIKQETQAVLKQKQELEAEIRKMNADEYIEELARRELGLVKPGEVIYKFVEPDVTRSEP